MNVLARFLALGVVCLCATLLPLTRGNVEPELDTLFVSRREVKCLAESPDGALWIGTTGGILRCDPKTNLSRTFTIADGLPTNEITAIHCDGPEWRATTPRGDVVWEGGHWQRATDSHTVATLPAAHGVPTSRLIVRGKEIALPTSAGSHVSAMTQRGDTVWLAFFADAHLYRWSGTAWECQPVDLLEQAGEEITALCLGGSGNLYLGTRRHGAFVRKAGAVVWEPIGVTTDGPGNHNAQAMARYNGELFVSTLEDGLSVLSPVGWRHIGTPTLSSNAPRQMVTFQGTLYLRHGDGKVDAYDGSRWQTNIFRDLPRKQVSALATDEHYLYAAQWGGWSAWDGRQWTHLLSLAELQGVPITVLRPNHNGTTLWVGTQSKGLAEVDIATGTIRRWHNANNGITDDWITEIACLPTESEESLVVGTFVGGAYHQEADGRWRGVPGTEGENVTGIASPEGHLLLATRHGMRETETASPLLTPLLRDTALEVQCLCLDEHGIWVGTRTGIFYRRLTDTDNKK